MASTVCNIRVRSLTVGGTSVRQHKNSSKVCETIDTLGSTWLLLLEVLI